MHYTYRHCGAPDDVIFTQARSRRARRSVAIAAEMENHRVAGGDAMIKSRTGGSTFRIARPQGLAAHRCRAAAA
jgi:UDP-N-acetylmuramate dehydrogenase